MPSPPITATRMDVAASDVGAEVMSRRLVVVGPLATVVPQVERCLQGLVAVGVLGLVVGGTPAVGVHVVHGTAPHRLSAFGRGTDDEPLRGGAGASGRGSHERDQELGIADRAEEEVLG